MLAERLNDVNWTGFIFVEMFLAGVAGGLFLPAAILALSGRGRSPAARTAPLIALPLMLIVAILLSVDLNRPERFWHMVLMNERLAPIFKPWSPISLGTYLIIVFSLFAFVAFVDALFAGGMVRVGRFGHDRTVLSGGLHTAWTVITAILGMSVAIYAGVLLTVTNIPGWADAPLIAAVYAATSAVTGVAMLVLVQSLRGQIDSDVVALARTNTWLIAWWLTVIVLFVVTLLLSVDNSARYFLTGLPLMALLAAVVLGGVIPLLLRPTSRARASNLALSAGLVLVAGFCLRLGIVLGPQLWIH